MSCIIFVYIVPYCGTVYRTIYGAALTTLWHGCRPCDRADVQHVLHCHPIYHCSNGASIAVDDKELVHPFTNVLCRCVPNAEFDGFLDRVDTVMNAEIYAYTIVTMACKDINIEFSKNK